MSENSKTAEATFREGFNCAQAVLSACGPRFGIGRELALRIAAGFGGGMGTMGRTCGAVTGAFMVIGLARGASDPGDAD